MFLSGTGRRRSGASALTGPVTVPGTMAGAYVEGERREMSVFAPGGYHWVPGLGDEVLVLKAGEQGERPCVVGCVMGEAGLTRGGADLRRKGGHSAFPGGGGESDGKSQRQRDFGGTASPAAGGGWR